VEKGKEGEEVEEMEEEAELEEQGTPGCKEEFDSLEGQACHLRCIVQAQQARDARQKVSHRG
jgi:hypothetical protein